MHESAPFQFRLYVADNLLNSTQARKNLTALCEQYLAGRYEIELVDVFSAPQRALEDGIGMTPTLLRLLPLPVQRFVGLLAQTSVTAEALGFGEAVRCE